MASQSLKAEANSYSLSLIDASLPQIPYKIMEMESN